MPGYDIKGHYYPRAMSSENEGRPLWEGYEDVVNEDNFELLGLNDYLFN